MALNNFGLGFIFRATDLATGNINRIRASFRALDIDSKKASANIGSSLRNLALGFGGVVAGGAIIAGAFDLAKEAGTFRQSVTDVGLVAGATAEELGQLEAAARKTARETQFTPTETIKGLRKLAQAGLFAHGSIEALPDAVNFAAASLGQLSPEQAAGVAAQTMKGFSIEAEDLTFALDKVAKITQRSQAEFKEMPNALGRLTRGAQRMNQSLDDTLISFGLVRNVLGSGQQAATATTVAMERLVDPKRRAKFEKAFGVSVVDKATGEFRNYTDILIDAAEASKGLGEVKLAETLTEVFRERGGGAFGVQIKQLNKGVKDASGNLLKGADAIQFYRDELSGASGVMEIMAKERLKNLAGALDLLKGAFGDLKISLGSAFEPIFQSMAEGLLVFVRAASAFIGNVPEPWIRAFGQITLAAGSFLFLTGGFLLMKGVLMLAKVAMDAMNISSIGLAKTFLRFSGVAGFVMIAFGLIKSGVIPLKELIGVSLEEVTVSFKALLEFFKEGSLSKATNDELNAVGGASIIFARTVDFLRKLPGFFKGFTDGMTEAFVILAPVFKVLLNTLGVLAMAVGWVGRAFFNLGQGEAKGFESTGKKLGRVVGFLVGAFVLFRGAVFMAEVTIKAYKITQLAVIAVQKIHTATIALGNAMLKAWTLITRGAAAATLFYNRHLTTSTQKMNAHIAVTKGATSQTQKLGAMSKVTSVAMAAGMGFALGSIADQAFDLSGKLAGVLLQMRGISEAADRVTKKRGIIKLDAEGTRESGRLEEELNSVQRAIAAAGVGEQLFNAAGGAGQAVLGLFGAEQFAQENRTSDLFKLQQRELTIKRKQGELESASDKRQQSAARTKIAGATGAMANSHVAVLTAAAGAGGGSSSAEFKALMLEQRTGRNELIKAILSSKDISLNGVAMNEGLTQALLAEQGLSAFGGFQFEED